MAVPFREILKYELAVFSPSATIPGWLARIRLFGSAGEIGLIEFRPDNASLLEPQVSPSGFSPGYARMYMQISRFHAVAEMLRMEKPLFLHAGQWQGRLLAYLATTEEPVGEHEPPA